MADSQTFAGFRHLGGSSIYNKRVTSWTASALNASSAVCLLRLSKLIARSTRTASPFAAALVRRLAVYGEVLRV